MYLSEFWPEPSAHRRHWETHNNFHVYEYDPTDDGPEVEIVSRIHAAHPDGEIGKERGQTRHHHVGVLFIGNGRSGLAAAVAHLLRGPRYL